MFGATRYDRELIDVFELQDELTPTNCRLYCPDGWKASRDKNPRAKLPEDMAAYDLLLAGKIHHHRFTKDDNLKALELLDRAIKLDCNFAAAYAWKALCAGPGLWVAVTCPTPRFSFKALLQQLKRHLPSTIQRSRLIAYWRRSRWRTGDSTRPRDTTNVRFWINPNDPRLHAQKR